MKNSTFKFHHFSFQSSKFAFCQFSLLSFKSPQFSFLLTHHPYIPLVLTIIQYLLYHLFLNLKQHFLINKKNPEIKITPNNPNYPLTHII